jgi:transcriptional regulator with XRE-family HTH domain
MLDARIVGRVIQCERERKGLSQEVLSGLAGIGRTHLSAIERGERKPTLETFWRISVALDINSSELFAAIEREVRLQSQPPESH